MTSRSHTGAGNTTAELTLQATVTFEAVVTRYLASHIGKTFWEIFPSCDNLSLRSFPAYSENILHPISAFTIVWDWNDCQLDIIFDPDFICNNVRIVFPDDYDIDRLFTYCQQEFIVRGSHMLWQRPDDQNLFFCINTGILSPHELVCYRI